MSENKIDIGGELPKSTCEDDVEMAAYFAREHINMIKYALKNIPARKEDNMIELKDNIIDKNIDMFIKHDMSMTGIGKHLGYWITSKFNDPFKSMPHPEDFIDESWDIVEREIVANYLDNGKDVKWWRGYSWCRLGCTRGIGTTDKSDGFYTWPAGFSHYIREHSVKPPQEFIDHVLEIAPQTEVFKPVNSGFPSIYPLPDWMVVGTIVKVVKDIPGSILMKGDIAYIHSFYENRVNICKLPANYKLQNEWEMPGDLSGYSNYLRGDFVYFFGKESDDILDEGMPSDDEMEAYINGETE